MNNAKDAVGYYVGMMKVRNTALLNTVCGIGPCLHCGKDTANKKFCSHSCSASYNNKGVLRTIKKERSACVVCGSETVTVAAKYCRKCIAIGQHTIRTRDLADAKTDKTRRTYLIRIRGHECEVCNNIKWMNKDIPLEIDHIDGNSDNNLEKNLQLICPNCHAQTDNYKGKNIGKGRHYRRVRYKAGQSY